MTRGRRATRCRSRSPATGEGSLATIGRRALARLIDTLIIGIPATLVLLRYVDPERPEDPIDAPLWLFYLVGLVAPVLYETLLISWRGQTVGKATTAVRVQRVVDGGLPASWQALVRILLPVAIANIPLSIFPLLSIGVYLLAIGHPLRQGLHDRAAGTVVVSTR